MDRKDLAGFIIIILLFSVLSFSYSSPPPVFVIDIDDVIGPVTHRYIKRSLEKAEYMQADILIIRLNTPGGLVHSMEKILVEIINSPLCVIVYVYPQGGGANSAGVFLVASSDIAAMAPQTNIGSAHPVASDGQEIDETLQEKITNALIAKIKGISEEKQRNVTWYEEAVTMSLNITASEALEIGVIDIYARDISDLLIQIDNMTLVKNNIENTLKTENAQIIFIEQTFSERFLSYLQDPNLFMIFLSLGMLGLFIEITNPGLIFPGVLGSIFLVLGFFASQVLPISVAGLVLLVLAFLFFAFEIMRPGFGVFGFGGIVAFVLGGIMLFDRAETGLYVSRSLIFGIAFGMLVVLFVLMGSVFQLFSRKDYLSFDRYIGSKVYIRRVSGRDIYIHFDGSYWLAEADQPVNEGDLVEITGKKERIILVKKV